MEFQSCNNQLNHNHEQLFIISISIFCYNFYFCQRFWRKGSVPFIFLCLFIKTKMCIINAMINSTGWLDYEIEILVELIFFQINIQIFISFLQYIFFLRIILMTKIVFKIYLNLYILFYIVIICYNIMFLTTRKMVIDLW